MEIYIGIITKIIDRNLYKIEVDIPERGKGFIAFPTRGEMDEPRVGDNVVLRELDSEFHSYFLYERLKENKFIGIRSRGKKIKITEDEIEIGIYNDNDAWKDQKIDSSEKEEDALFNKDMMDIAGGDASPDCSTACIKISKSGDITIKTTTSLTLDAKTINIRGGQLILPNSARAIGSATGGPFYASSPDAPATGTPLMGGNIINLS